jgi:hypothetical protein
MSNPTSPTTPGPATTAARSAADGISGIDQQVNAALAVSVDSSLLPSLTSHLSTLHSDLAQWATPIRPSVTTALTQTFAEHQAVLSRWPVDEKDQAALVAYAGDLQTVVGASATSIGQVGTDIAPLRTGVDTCLGSLRDDDAVLSTQLKTDQDAMEQLQEQIDVDEEEQEEYNENPWQFMFQSGFDIVGVLSQLTDLLASMKNEGAATDQLQSLVDAVGQLSNAGGALNTLSSSLGGLSTSLVNLQTAVAQIDNTLTDIVKEPPLPPILSAQLEQMVSDLRSADGIIAGLSGGS